MAKLLVTFEVDTVKMFDMLHSIKGDTAPLGMRLADVMMTGKDESFLTAVGLAAYGVTVSNIEAIRD